MMRNNKKAFTLVEMLVALGLVVAMLAGSGYIFTMAVKAQKASKATSEIMEKLRVVTDQLNSDFEGFRKDMPMFIRFNRYQTDINNDGNNEEHRVDQIMFFADGEFESMRQYADTADSPPVFRSVKGGVARIQYALSTDTKQFSSYEYSRIMYQYGDYAAADTKPEERFLTRQQHILSSDDDVCENIYLFPKRNYLAADIEDSIELHQSFVNDEYNQKWEHDCMTPDEWKAIEIDVTPGDNDFADAVIPACFERLVDLNVIDSKGQVSDNIYAMPDKRYHLLLADQVSEMKVQFSYYDSVEERQVWFPSIDPLGDGTEDHFIENNDCDFFEVDQDVFGVMFNTKVDHSLASKSEVIDYDNTYEASDSDTDVTCVNNSYKWYTFKDELPKAIKFTFTIHDDRDVIKGGKTFTHIVYIND